MCLSQNRWLHDRKLGAVRTLYRWPPAFGPRKGPVPPREAEMIVEEESCKVLLQNENRDIRAKRLTQRFLPRGRTIAEGAVSNSGTKRS